MLPRSPRAAEGVAVRASASGGAVYGIGGPQLGHLVICGTTVGRVEHVDRARVAAKTVVTRGPSHNDITGDRRTTDTTDRNAFASHELRNLGPSSAAVGRAKDVYVTPTTDCYGAAVDRHGAAEIAAVAVRGF